MKYLLDTNALSEPARRRPSPAFMERMGRLSGRVCTSVLCVAEMVYGARRIPDRASYETYLAEVVLQSVPVLAVDLGVATLYGELRAAMERVGHRAADIDLLIAATALHHDLVLVTRNVRHFAAIPELVIEDWTVR